MEKTTFKVIAGIIYIVIGLLFSIYYRQIGQWVSDFYYKWHHIKFSVRVFQVAFLILGMFFILLGLLIAFNMNLGETLMASMVGILLIIVGSWFAIYFRQFGQSNSDIYYKLFQVRISVRVFQIAHLIGGLTAVILGFLITFRIV